MNRLRSHSEDIITSRIRVFLVVFSVLMLLIVLRLFYWQVIQRSKLQAAAEEQYQQEIKTQGQRGTIYTAEGSVLVTNEKVYRLFAQPQFIKDSETTAAKLATILSKTNVDTNTDTYTAILDKISQPDKKWINVKEGIPESIKNEITELNLPGVGFDSYLQRSYPEASLAAQLTGFVGKDKHGNDIGYFGIEGALEKELKGRQTANTVATDALGQQLVHNSDFSAESLRGRDVTMTIRRDMQFLAETELKKGIEKYRAKAGEIIIMEPKTGSIRAMASYPSYDQQTFYQYPAEHYKNPAVSNVYEPGSTFKVLTVAAGIDTKKIQPETTCPTCGGPRVFGKYTIRTWNDQYYPNTTMTDGLAHSDNTAMIYIAEQLGSETFQEYLKKFGIGEEIHLDMQEDTSTPFPSKWGPVELATSSFGQGIGTTSLQMVRAIGAIANDGVMMRPKLVESVKHPDGTVLDMPPTTERTVISKETAETVTQMMIKAVDAGEAQWTKSRDHTVAGKTGTSQIAVNGSYDPDKTIASFVGFAPADDPQFIMLVKLVEPESSIWAAETAAPLWYSVANRLFVMMKIQPDR